MKLTGRIYSRLWLAIMALLTVFLLMPAGPSSASSGGKLITSYSADMVMIEPGGGISGKTRLYITPEAYRMDGMLMGAGQHGMPEDMTTLGLKKQNRQYIYNHDKKLVYESGIDEQEMMKTLDTYQDVDSEVVLGRETISGYACTMKKVTTTSSFMGRTVSSTQTIWQSDRFEMPLRTLTEEGYVTELRNIVVRKPAANLFEPLSGYTRVNSMMAVMGMDFMPGGTQDELQAGDAEQPREVQDLKTEAREMMRGVGEGIKGFMKR